MESDTEPQVEPQNVVAPTVAQKAGAPGILVTPELFDLAARWAAEPAGTRSATANARAAAPAADLVAFAQLHAPELASEAASLRARMKGPSSEAPSAVLTGCACQVLATFDTPGASPSGSGWSMSFAGAAHSASIYDSHSGGSTEATSNSAVYQSQLKTRMMCATPGGAACSAGCTAKLYADVLYSSQVSAEADTGGIWTKGATAQLVDGATLDLTTPFGGSGTHLFEKATSISQWARHATFDPVALAGVLKGALAIGTAIVKLDPSNIDGTLIDDTVKSFFGLRHAEGSNGYTAQGLIVKFESPTWQPIPMAYSSSDNLSYGLNLATNVQMHVRGYGGWHRGQGTIASSYSMAAYVDNFVCDPGVTPPARSAFWRYDAYDGAAVSKASLQARVGNFFYLGFGAQADVSKNQGSISQGVCGDGICGGLESETSCAVDCVKCGDNKCSPSESVQTCPGDCIRCGDGQCSPGENVQTCPGDCGYCGDGYCASDESVYNCADCGYCGDGVCSVGEDSCSCSIDCGLNSNFKMPCDYTLN